MITTAFFRNLISITLIRIATCVRFVRQFDDCLLWWFVDRANHLYLHTWCFTWWTCRELRFLKLWRSRFIPGTLMLQIKNSPNSCLQHGVLAMNLINSLGVSGLASRRRPSFLSHVCSDIHILDSALFRMLLWPPGNSQLRTASSLSGSMGGSFLSHVLANIHIFELPHLSSTIVIINIVQTRQ